jgi:hypothetical protein
VEACTYEVLTKVAHQFSKQSAQSDKGSRGYQGHAPHAFPHPGTPQWTLYETAFMRIICELCLYVLRAFLADGFEQSESFQNIYIDDASGLTPLTADEPVLGLRGETIRLSRFL